MRFDQHAPSKWMGHVDFSGGSFQEVIKYASFQEAAMSHNNIQQVQPRLDVEVHLPDERVLCGPRGASAGSFLQSIA
jgi:hypothetical protein